MIVLTEALTGESEQHARNGAGIATYSERSKSSPESSERRRSSRRRRECSRRRWGISCWWKFGAWCALPTTRSRLNSGRLRQSSQMCHRKWSNLRQYGWFNCWSADQVDEWKMKSKFWEESNTCLQSSSHSRRTESTVALRVPSSWWKNTCGKVAGRPQHVKVQVDRLFLHWFIWSELRPRCHLTEFAVNLEHRSAECGVRSFRRNTMVL